jgi:hypothetical protein
VELTVTRRADTAAVTADVLAAVRGVPGVRLSSPVPRTATTARLPWDSGVLAVDLTDELLRVKLVALRLPLPPLLDAVESAVRAALAGTPWADVGLRLIVSDVDVGALRRPP